MTSTHVPDGLYNKYAEVHRRASASDGAGGWVITWQPVGHTRARRSQPSAAQQVLAQQAGSRITDTWYLPPGADVWRGDRLIVGDLTFEVEAVVEPSEPIYRRADCSRTQHERTT